MSVWSVILNVTLLISGTLLLCGISFLVTQDAVHRGFSQAQVYWLRVAGVIFFPVGLILYLVFRPSARTSA